MVARDLDNEAGTSWDELGETTFEMGKLIGSANSMLILPLMYRGKKMGNLIVRAEKVARKNDILTLNFGCRDMTGFGFCSSPKPFLVYVSVIFAYFDNFLPSLFEFLGWKKL